MKSRTQRSTIETHASPLRNSLRHKYSHELEGIVTIIPRRDRSFIIPYRSPSRPSSWWRTGLSCPQHRCSSLGSRQFCSVPWYFARPTGRKSRWSGKCSRPPAWGTCRGIWSAARCLCPWPCLRRLSRVLGVVSPPWNDASAPIDDPRFTAASADSGTGSRKNRAEGTGSADWTLFPVPLHLLRPIDRRLKRRRAIQRRHHLCFLFIYILFRFDRVAAVANVDSDRESDRALLEFMMRWCWKLERSCFEKGLDSIIRGERITKPRNCETGDIVLWNERRNVIDRFEFNWCLEKINEVLELWE